MTTPTRPSGSRSGTTDNRQRLIVGAAVIIILSLGLNAYLLYQNMKKGEEVLAVTNELDESEKLKADLERQYYEALTDLEEQRTRNDDLNALIDQQKEELRQQKERIESMLGDRNRLREARAEIQNMSVKADQYLAEINQLKSENQILTARNLELNQAKSRLEDTLKGQRRLNEELSQSQAELERAKKSLEMQRETLSQKVEQASTIQIGNIDVEGQRINNRGNAVRRKAAKNVEQLELCFGFELNELTPPGEEVFFIRIIDPSGVTLAIDELGSGEFTPADKNDRMRYTFSQAIQYDQTPGRWCSRWNSGQSFSSGDYQVEVYHRGYLAGTGTFSLK